MTGDKKQGVAAAIEGVDPAEAVPAEDEQLELLPLDGAEERTAVRAISMGEAAKRPGRPPGARNKRTEEIRAFILAQHSHPLQVMAQIYSMKVEDLARELGCKRAEALRLQLDAADKLAPYIEGKMPVNVNLNHLGDFSLVIETGDPHAVGAGDLDGEGLVIDVSSGDAAGNGESEGNQ